MSREQESNMSNELVVLARRLLLTKGDDCLSTDRLKETAYSLAEEVIMLLEENSDAKRY